MQGGEVPHNFTLYVFKNIINNIFINPKYIKGINVQLNGNLGKKPRSLQKIIQLGKNIGNVKLNSKIEFCETTCYTKKGTFGIKIKILF